ncbi:MAG: succinate--CoA ligase subunit beta, partial [Chloroflexi bacterium CG_4_9_14_3_um_filter_45_9]
MKIHEFQAKALLSQYGIPVPRGRVAYTPAEVKEIATELGAKVV